PDAPGAANQWLTSGPELDAAARGPALGHPAGRLRTSRFGQDVSAARSAGGAGGRGPGRAAKPRMGSPVAAVPHHRIPRWLGLRRPHLGPPVGWPGLAAGSGRAPGDAGAAARIIGAARP